VGPGGIIAVILSYLVAGCLNGIDLIEVIFALLLLSSGIIGLLASPAKEADTGAGN
jgi:hypothetical protein